MTGKSINQDFIGPLIGICSIICGVTMFFFFRENELNRLGRSLILASLAFFVYLNHFVLRAMIQRLADKSAFVNVYDNTFLSEIIYNLTCVMVAYILASSFCSYLGAKSKFKKQTTSKIKLINVPYFAVNMGLVICSELLGTINFQRNHQT